MTRRDAHSEWHGPMAVECPTGKRAYKTKADAKYALAHQWGGRKANRMSVYRCTQCPHFHLGHLHRTVRRGLSDGRH